MRKVLLVFILFVLISILADGVFVYFYLNSPLSHEPATLVVQRGAPMKMIARQLQKAGIIKYADTFTLYARASGQDKKIRAGEYEFETGLTPLGVLYKMVRGDVKLYKITLIEGWTIKQMADYLAMQTFAPQGLERDFILVCKDHEFLKSIGLDVDSAEGFLFPDTYFISRPRDAKEIVERLVSRFKEVYAFNVRADELGLGLNQVVTLASIIEKETGSENERPFIASVFHNRLKLGMPLQADPTVIYGLKDFNGNLTRADLTNPHPYNTYVHKGLPPGPISNPSLSSIKAALWPSDAKYLYFVAKGDGTHEFSETFKQHINAIRKYQNGLYFFKKSK